MFLVTKYEKKKKLKCPSEEFWIWVMENEHPYQENLATVIIEATINGLPMDSGKTSMLSSKKRCELAEKSGR